MIKSKTGYWFVICHIKVFVAHCVALLLMKRHNKLLAQATNVVVSKHKVNLKDLQKDDRKFSLSISLSCLSPEI